MNESERPTRTYKPGSPTENYREDHPAYAMIGASRVSSMGPGGGARLFGSDFRHQAYVTVSIRTASLSRSHQSEHVHGEKELIEVALSEAQWATFVSSMNVGYGVPATLTRARGVEGFLIPAIEDDTDRREQFVGEMNERLADTIDRLKALRETLPTKKAKGEVDAILQEFRANLPYLTEQFDKHAEKTVERAKVEVNAYVTQMLQRAGLTALTGGEAPLALDTKETTDER
jgi:hypothetical protein